MGNALIAALRVIIAVSLVGSLVVQTVIVPLVWIDLEGEPLAVRATVVVVAVLGVVTLQVFAICVWRLLGMVRRGSVFSTAAFGYVDAIVGAVAAAAVLTLVLAVLLARGEVAPGVVGLVCGAALVLGGIALLVVVMRKLLAQAIELRSELNEVI